MEGEKADRQRSTHGHIERGKGIKDKRFSRMLFLLTCIRISNGPSPRKLKPY